MVTYSALTLDAAKYVFGKKVEISFSFSFPFFFAEGATGCLENGEIWVNFISFAHLRQGGRVVGDIARGSHHGLRSGDHFELVGEDH